RTKGPRSLMRTFTDLPFSGFVTLTTEPIGRFLEAAVKALGLKGSPLVVFWPASPGPYQEAFTTLLAGAWLAGVGVATGWLGSAATGCMGRGAGRAAHAYQQMAGTSPAAIIPTIRDSDTAESTALICSCLVKISRC